MVRPLVPSKQLREQLSFLDDFNHGYIVNVAAVPQRSLFRYPGGKTWLIPRVRKWIASFDTRPHELIEPFAGGGIVSLTVAFEHLAEHVTMVELDRQVAAVWDTVINGDANWLAERIAKFDLTPESVIDVLTEPALTLHEKAFQTILKNRVNRGGILAHGAGKIKQGENGKGLKSRWYPQTLKQRIEDILCFRHRIRFLQGDGLAVLRENAQCRDAIFFIDPPYTAGGKRAGSRLYTHSALDHESLFAIATTLTGDFLMTYDNAEEIRRLADKYALDTHTVAMKNTHHTEMTELLIGRNLEWARRY